MVAVLSMRMFPTTSAVYSERIGSRMLRSKVERVFPIITRSPSPLAASMRCGMVTAMSTYDLPLPVAPHLTFQRCVQLFKYSDCILVSMGYSIALCTDDTSSLAALSTAVSVSSCLGLSRHSSGWRFFSQ